MAWSAEKDLEQSRMTEAKRTEGGESARMPLYLLALLGLVGCIAEPPSRRPQQQRLRVKR